MTNEEAIMQLKKCKSFHNGSYGEALEMAIQALKQQSSEDCISREVIEKLKKYCLCYDTSTTIPKADIFVKIADIAELPPVTPQPKIGKWIDTGIGKEELYGEMFVCSECNEVSYGENYCPNCGAKMEVMK